MEEQQQSESVAQVKGKAVPVYVMMPLDSVTNGHGVNMKKAMDESFTALKRAGVEGVMMDVWWGLVEREEPCVYNWGGYSELMEMAGKRGLKVQAVMSFHQCGGNVGDSCNIPLPKWVLKEMHEDQELAYTDQWGRRNYEYVSLGCDTLPVLKGRTPVQCYSDFMRAFRDEFKRLLGNTIVEIQVGMGPAGELRYPSYPEKNKTWEFPGIGAFQCFDEYMLKSLKDKATNVGIPEWGTPPSRASTGCYKDRPENTAFFKQENGGWSRPEGKFFLKWYSKILLKHGDRILTSANSIFNDYAANINLSVKVAGIHWHYGTQSHAAELTAGYYNTAYDHDGYRPIAQMLAKHGAIFNFTCIEMQDFEQQLHAANCAPQQLVRQVAKATCESEAIVELAGENALKRYDEVAYEQIYKSSMLILDGWEGGEKQMRSFTYLRMNRKLFEHRNWKKFVALVMKMKEGKNARNTPLDHFEKLTKQKVLDDGAAAFMHWPQGH